MQRNGFIKKGLSSFGIYLLLFSIVMNGAFAATPSTGAGTPAYKDLPSKHWAASAIDHLKGYGVLSGYPDGTIRPNQPITRVEFAAMINRLFGFNALSSALLKDRTASAWANTEISKAIEAGYLSLDQDRAAHPNSPISRAEVAAALSKVFHFTAASGKSSPSFSDLDGLEQSTVNAISALAQGGYSNGFADGTFKPGKTISRAELAAMLDRITALYVNKEGIVAAGSVKGNAVLNHSDVVIENTVVEGNLYLTPGIGDGDVKLDKVTVKGTTFVQGGGDHSVTLNDSRLATLVVNKKNSLVRVVISGTVDQLIVDGLAHIILAEGAVIKQFIITQQADKTTIEGKGKIEKFDNQAAGVLFNGKELPSGISAGNMATGGSASGGGGGGGGGTTTSNPWTLAWSDEFDGNTIDPTKWTFDTTNGASVNIPGWGNNELQYYTSRPDNVKVENGKLVITAKKEEYEGFHYTSARIKTKGLFKEKYGKYEIRAKTPAGKGYWPAIWMLPEDNAYGTWAASGEIDIMETWGSKPDTIAGTLHYGQPAPGNTSSGKEYKFVNSTTQQYHTYAIEWEPNEIRWYVDGHLYSTQNDWYSRSANQPDVNSYPAPFDQPFHLIMNVAVGGNFDGDPTPDTVFPQAMEIDYVRYYKLTGRSYSEPTPPTLTKESYLPGSKLPQAPDNDMVYNAGFTQTTAGDAGMGVSGTAHWNLFQEPGSAAATVAIESIDDRNYAKVSISNGGGNPYSIQPQAIVSLAKGRYYKLTFDAKTDSSRLMNVKLTGGQSRGFTAYSPSLSVPLTDTFQSYQMSFQMKQDSDIAARIEFNMGTNTHPVWFGNVKLVEIDSIAFEHDLPKTPYGPEGNHIYNGTFDQGEPNRLSYWHLIKSGGSQATASVNETERKLNLNIANGGSAADQLQWLQRGLPLINGQSYLLAWEGSANAARAITVRLQSKNGDKIYAEQTLNLTTVTEMKSMSFTMNEASTNEAQLVFHLGGSAGNLKLDNIKLVRTSLYLDPTVVKFPLRNGQFDGGLAGWRTVANDGATLAASTQQSQATLSIGGTGPNPWSALFLQEGLSASNGIPYLFEFDAYATTNRKMQAVIENSAYQPSFSTIIDLTAEKKRYRFEFMKSGSENVDLKFLLGRIGEDAALGAHDVFIDNVVFEPKGAIGLSNRLTNGTFDANTAGWTSFFHNGGGVTGAVYGENGSMKASLNRSGPDSWNAQVDYENVTIEQNKSYRLTFDASSTIDRNIQVVVEHKGGDYAKYLEPRTVALTDTTQTYSYTFTSNTATDTGAHVNFLLGRIDDAIDAAHDLYFDNISLVEVTMPSLEGHALLNGTFDANMDHWKTYVNDGADTTVFAVDAQKLKVDFPNYDGWFQWSTQVFQTGLKLVAGKTYVLSFDARSSIGKSVLVQVENGSTGLHLPAQPVLLTSAELTHTFEFTVSGDTDQNAILNFLLGSNNVPGSPPSPDYSGPLFQPHSIWIDNVTLIEKP
ncbi:carbohydrate binding domain-containing protein [Cohnella cholangitidis]|uniref:Family 16 glycosylhydrolase n=1 Tax=Cohnella cholangitidis TaxID=2598458 RepID=A0A7G5C3Q9_9BACL|nr:carbohydrate binding domain-containing protein [Cohnella cholangitidis]QMV43843.1 family 16 glycosylhydrolase [Cohnella cholangitidis]